VRGIEVEIDELAAELWELTETELQEIQENSVSFDSMASEKGVGAAQTALLTKVVLARY
jgi:hypothetical protein